MKNATTPMSIILVQRSREWKNSKRARRRRMTVLETKNAKESWKFTNTREGEEMSKMGNSEFRVELARCYLQVGFSSCQYKYSYVHLLSYFKLQSVL